MCKGDILKAIKDCAEAAIMPTHMLECVADALGAGSDCLPCACELVKKYFPIIKCT